MPYYHGMSHALKDRIALRALRDAPHEGWTMDALRRAAENEGQKAQMAAALFTGMDDAARHISALFDRMMMEQLVSIDTENMKVRERIACAVRTRLDIMAPYRDCLRVSMAHWARPMRSVRAAKTLWRSADQIWTWAGDTATDYNHYTKRALLSGVMASTLLYWFQDTLPASAGTRQFLDRRITNVLSVGKVIGTLRKKAA